MTISAGSFIERVGFWRRLKQTFVLFGLPLIAAVALPIALTMAPANDPAHPIFALVSIVGSLIIVEVIWVLWLRHSRTGASHWADFPLHSAGPSKREQAERDALYETIPSASKNTEAAGDGARNSSDPPASPDAAPRKIPTEIP